MRTLRGHANLAVLGVALLCLTLGAASAQESEDPCLMCHTSPALFRGQEDPDRLLVTAEELAGSVHEMMGGSCVLCHQGMEYPHLEARIQPTCSPCHTEVEEQFEGSLHGYAVARGNPRAPTCANCHGVHDILASSDPEAPTHKVRLPNTCARCHGQAGLLTDQLVRLPQNFTAYAQSVHGQGTARGLAAAASCADCHSVHDLKSAADPESRIHPLNVATTCGQCHPDIQLDYDRSIHGRALAAGLLDSPTCTGCHGEHLILSPDNPAAGTSGSHQATQTCGPCHNDPIIIAKYSLEGGVVGSYLDSYHGWVSRRDGGTVATCVDCHSAHLVLPEEDPQSLTHPDNVVATCRRCHPGADFRFAESYSHQSASISANPVNRIIRQIYIVLIVGVIGGMVIHNLVIINYYVMTRRREARAGGGDEIVRMNRSEVLQHLLLTVSFVVLVITGFALRYPETLWVDWLAAVGMTETVRGVTHRAAAVLMMVTALVHAYHVFLTRRGRGALRAMLPEVQDCRDVVDNLRYHTWRTEAHARFGRFDYSQKAEYWALVWGTLIMALTGLVLWFPTWAVKVFPVLVVPASQTIHFYEAILATLAIIVWHFFFVIFHPDEYPMSWTWITGKMSMDSVRKHHARWYEEEIATTPEAEASDLGIRASAAAFTLETGMPEAPEPPKESDDP